jgi:hypothetical protein
MEQSHVLKLRQKLLKEYSQIVGSQEGKGNGRQGKGKPPKNGKGALLNMQKRKTTPALIRAREVDMFSKGGGEECQTVNGFKVNTPVTQSIIRESVSVQGVTGRESQRET